MGSRSRDRGGEGAGGPVAELSLPRFAILTAVFKQQQAPNTGTKIGERGGGGYGGK